MQSGFCSRESEDLGAAAFSCSDKEKSPCSVKAPSREVTTEQNHPSCRQNVEALSVKMKDSS